MAAQLGNSTQIGNSRGLGLRPAIFKPGMTATRKIPKVIDPPIRQA